MKFIPLPTKYLSKIIIATATGALIFALSLLQSNILKVDAALQVLLVSDTAIPFGMVFPGENLSETYSVQLDNSSQSATYSTVLTPVVGKQDLCPHLEIKNIDLPLETDTLAASNLTSVTDGVDNWQVKLNVPGIEGQVAQAHDGGIVVSGGDFECKITITTKTVEVFGEGFIQGIKFNDLNGDGIKNNSETGLGGFEIYLDENNNSLYDPGEKTVTTATTTGFYAFEFLPVDTYVVREVMQNNWQQTLPGVSGNFKYEIFVDNQTFENINFGNRFVEGFSNCEAEECPPGGSGDSGNSTDLSLQKTVNQSTTTASSTLIYTFVVSNSGPVTASSVTMTDVLPAELVFVSASSSFGSFVPNVWTVGDLPSGSVAILEIVTTVKPTVSFGQVITNTANVLAAQADPNLLNNNSSVNTEVVCPIGQICTTSDQGGGGGGGGSGGSGSSGGGGSFSSGGGGIIPAGEVAGALTEVPSNFGGLQMPIAQPKVLGAESTLPETGVPTTALTILGIISAALGIKYKPKK